MRGSRSKKRFSPIRRISALLMLGLAMLATFASAQQQGGFISSAEVLAVVEVPDATPRVHTITLGSSSLETRTATFVVKNITNQRWEYDITETLAVGGFEWLRVISYSGVVESRTDVRNSGRDVVEFITFCPDDPLRVFGNSFGVAGDIIIRLKDPSAGSAEQRVRVELSCAPRASITVPIVPGPQGPAGPAGPQGSAGVAGPMGPAYGVLLGLLWGPCWCSRSC
ncbi:MAG: hypothetical protein R2880_17050 [Deinococcales bacterium]